MARHKAAESRLPKGVAALPRSRAGRQYRARIRRAKGVEVHLGLYETPWLAAFAYNVAAGAIGRGSGAPPNEIPRDEQPDADRVRAITALVRRRLGLDPASIPPKDDRPPTAERLVTTFEITAVGFWRAQASHVASTPEDALAAAARRLVEAADALFWCRSAGHPDPLEIMVDLLDHRLGRAFGDRDLTREVLLDDGDDPLLVARWLVYPETFHGARARGFRAEVRALYPDFFTDEGPDDALPSWASVLGISPPFDVEKVRRAYRERSRQAHPDVGGSPEDFVRLRRAYEQGRRHCESMGE